MAVTANRIDQMLQVWSAGPTDKNALATLLKEMIEVGAESAGAAGSGGISAAEYGTGIDHQTVLTFEDVALPDIAGGANLAVGKLAYTFPAGEIIVESASMALSLTQTDGNVTADTPDIGIGTVIGSGAVAVLGGTATFEDIITGQTAADVDGAVTTKTSIPTAGVPLVIATAAAHTVHVNVADGWAANGDDGILINGTLILNWKLMAEPTP